MKLLKAWRMSRAYSYSHSRAHSPTFTVTSPTSQLILQPFPRFTYVTAHSPTLISPLLRHRIFTYVTGFSLTSQDFHLRHRIFTYVTGFSLTSQDFHLRHLASRPCPDSIPGYSLKFVCGNAGSGTGSTQPRENK